MHACGREQEKEKIGTLASKHDSDERKSVVVVDMVVVAGGYIIQFMDDS